MKKSISMFVGMIVLLLVAVPVLAKDSRPSRPTTDSTMNMVMISNESVALANSGLNMQNGSGTIRTGSAYADSLNLNTVGVSVVGCCDEEPTCCQQRNRRCGCEKPQESGDSVTNMVMVRNQSLALANSGANLQTGNVQTRPSCGNRTPKLVSGGTLTTGAATAMSGNDNLVNVMVSGMN